MSNYQIQIKQAANGEHFAKIVAGNNEIVMLGETWKNKSLPRSCPAMKPNPLSATIFLIVPRCMPNLPTRNTGDESMRCPLPEDALQRSNPTNLDSGRLPIE